MAQTNPTPQSLPYSQDFSGLLHTSTTYPAGLQGWKISGASTTSIITTGPTADHTLTANASASTTAGGVNNYNGKIGFLASGSTNPGLALSISTTGFSNIQLSYDIMVIRNPYDGGSNTRINESVLQYRLGEAGSFTTITGVEYQNTTVTQTGTGVTTPQNLQSKSVMLPAECNNQPIVQIRWLNHDQTGAGSRPGFAIDNIVAVQDNDSDGFVATNDCDDNNASVFPGASEVCNTLDDDCNGFADDGLTFTMYYADTDDDTFGDASNTSSTCNGLPAGYVNDNTDCDDSENTVYPGAVEICDGLDNDCNGDTDENTASASITPAGIVSLCKGDFITLNANTGIGYSYQWFKNGNLLTGATADNYTTNKTGYYEVQVNVPGGCFAVSSVTTVSGLSQPNANITSPNGLNLCAATVKLKASYNAAYTYQWYQDGAPIDGANSFIYYPAVIGDYYCSVTSANGCQRNTASLTVINACRETELSNIEFTISPNPSNGIFVIASSIPNTISGEATVRMYSIAGELISEKIIEISNGYFSAEINGSELSNGIYLIAVQSAASVYTDRIVINK